MATQQMSMHQQIEIVETAQEKADCTFLRHGAILLVSVPATMMRSLCRGLPRGTVP